MICLTDVESRHLSDLNHRRSQYGLPPLAASASLMQAAREKSFTIASTDVFDHNAGGMTPQQLAEKNGYRVRNGWVGENILWGTPDPIKANDAWMNSTGHRENILSGNYLRVGVSVGQESTWDYQGDVYAVGVQMFGTADDGTDVPKCAGSTPILEPTPRPRPDRPVEPTKPRRRPDLGREAHLPDSGAVKAQRQRMRLIRRILEGMFQ